jgi:hypothetical protein
LRGKGVDRFGRRAIRGDALVRPLAMGVARRVAAAMGWSLPYTLGVLGRWKIAAVYCRLR